MTIYNGKIKKENHKAYLSKFLKFAIEDIKASHKKWVKAVKIHSGQLEEKIQGQ